MTNERRGGNQTDQAPKPGDAGYEADQEEQDTQDRGDNAQPDQEQKHDQDEALHLTR